MTTMNATIRLAREDEIEALEALARRSKAHWGYDDSFMRAAAADLVVPRELVARGGVFVAERGDARVGFASLDGATLRDLWIDPPYIGSGLGAVLFTHVMSAARAATIARVRIESDPNAAAFYARMGARRAGSVASTVVPGRELPVFEMPTTDDAAIEDVVRAFFRAFANDEAERGSLDRLPSEFTADARISVLTAGEVRTYGVDEFIAPRRALLSSGAVTGFSEWETESTTLVHRDIACRRSRYAKRGVRDGSAFTGAGTKVFSFVRVPVRGGSAWKIHTLVWQDDD
jgi:GNAT superfamily N-acetyltransferase